MRRLMMVSTMVAVLGLAVIGGALAAKPVLNKEDFPVSFQLTSATCSYLPPGTVINGSGTEKSITQVKQQGGVTTVSNESHAHGTATDQDGNTYVFNYSNHFSVSNTGPTDLVLSGKMEDSFSLAGGPASLSNGFLALVHDLFELPAFTPLNSRGDPIDFPSGAPHCDPL
jgi:hypothetical protein